MVNSQPPSDNHTEEEETEELGAPSETEMVNPSMEVDKNKSLEPEAVG